MTSPCGLNAAGVETIRTGLCRKHSWISSRAWSFSKCSITVSNQNDVELGEVRKHPLRLAKVDAGVNKIMNWAVVRLVRFDTNYVDFPLLRAQPFMPNVQVFTREHTVFPETPPHVEDAARIQSL